MRLSAGFRSRVSSLHGAAGAAWLTDLSEQIRDYERRWSLTVGSPFELSYNYVAPALRTDGTSAVLKIGFPGDPEIATEIAALELFDGRGAARLLEVNPNRSVLLLERLEPGIPLSELRDDDAAMSAVASVMRRLWQPVPAEHRFPDVSRWAAGLARLRSRHGGTSGPLPDGLVSKAESEFIELIATMGRPILLHGDLHQGNILSAAREPWLAIDPKGVIGEPEYEAGAVLRNGLPDLVIRSEAARILMRRIELLSDELGCDPERIRRWGFAQTVLSAAWSLEDHGEGWELAIGCAELLREAK